ncbi:MBOAT family O-acyltransferase [Fusobacterium polymorphum]|uniref:MBOAT family protein n=1 Tax=Fusobacterium nucleatum subsp. polymorphum TaxID=76857 RepID=A0A241Q301_FUSNP|nr:MBOAT family O-acyltransferase [Fusobacterium polymorphum]ASG29174.1 hypothetical protein CBG61_09945 [Fusobacterium polymorphum]
MNFISFEFFAFLVVFFLIYFICPQKIKKIVLLIFSCFYIGFYKKEFLIFILGISLIFYLTGIFMDKYKNKKKGILIFSIIVTIGLLLYLKFFSHIITRFDIQNPILNSLSSKIYLPLGISFYTLQGISYIVDIYKEKYQLEKNFFNFLCYMTFFPIFLQGPISRYNQLSVQLKNLKGFNYEEFCFGLQLMLWGVFKKIVISNRLNMVANQIFDNYTDYTGVVILVSGMVYALELYTDFSGAVDITRGIAQSMNIEVMKNFNFPNSATSIKDFWSRWHISLSTWLRDYIYIPLGGNRKGKIRKYFNIMITFLVSGIWHGVGLKFLVWGGVHGFYQVFSDITTDFLEKIKVKIKYREFLTIISDNNNLEKFIKKVITFTLVSIAWIFFRAPSGRIAYTMLKKINHHFFRVGNFIHNTGLDKKDLIVLVVSILIMYLIERMMQRFSIRKKIASYFLPIRWVIYISFIHWIAIFGIYGEGYNPSNFIYMGF